MIDKLYIIYVSFARFLSWLHFCVGKEGDTAGDFLWVEPNHYVQHFPNGTVTGTISAIP